jgi:predicted nucleic acid-binding protein
MQAVDDLLEADVRRFPTLPLLPESWALRANLTPSDACNAALARNLGCPLVTGDRRLSPGAGAGCAVDHRVAPVGLLRSWSGIGVEGIGWPASG